MSKVKAFFKSLGADAEQVFEMLSHKLRATGGTAGADLAEAINHDAHSLMMDLKKEVLDAVDLAFSGSLTHDAPPTSSNIARAFDGAAKHFGNEVLRELVARLSCRVQGLDPDAPLHATQPGASETATSSGEQASATQPLDHQLPLV